MKLACPSCHHPIEVLDLDAELSAQISCPECGAVVGITLNVSILSAGDVREAASSSVRVVVAMTDRDLREAYAEALAKAGFAVTETSESRQTLQMLGRAVPDVAVVDGSFPAIFGMGIGEIIKKSNVTRDTRVLGLRTDAASPLPVPGADRTVPVTVGIETIVREVESLAARSAPAPQAAPRPEAAAPPEAMPARVEPAPAPPQARERPRPVVSPAPPAPASPAHWNPPPPEPPTGQQRPAAHPAQPGHGAHKGHAAPKGHDAGHGPEPAHGARPAPPAPAAAPAPPADAEHAAAQRLARIIISDTALYNQAAVEDGIRKGRLRETLMPLLQEGRQHYEDRTPPHVRADTDYLGTALDQFVDRKMKAMRPAAV